MLRAMVLAIAVLLAGCAEVADDPQTGNALAARLPDHMDFVAQGCQTSATFFLVDITVASRFLPPGYYPRDLSTFVYDSPATRHEFAVALAIIDCKDLQAVDMVDPRFAVLKNATLALAAVFIEPPNIDSARAQDSVDFDFYVHRWWGPPEQFILQYLPGQDTPLSMDIGTYQSDEGVVAQALEATPGVVGSNLPDRVEVMQAAATIGAPQQPFFQAQINASVPLVFEEPPSMKFWHQDGSGVTFIQFALEDRRSVPKGDVLCTVTDPGLRNFTGRSDRPADCMAHDSLALVFSEHELIGEIQHLAGARA